MGLKNLALDAMTMNTELSNAKNKISGLLFLVLSIIFLVISIISFLFSWKVGLVVLALAAISFGISKFAKFAVKVNENTIEKLQKMKEPKENERI